MYVLIKNPSNFRQVNFPLSQKGNLPLTSTHILFWVNHYFQFSAYSSISFSMLLYTYMLTGRSMELCLLLFAYENIGIVLEFDFFFNLTIHLKDFPTSVLIN